MSKGNTSSYNMFGGGSTPPVGTTTAGTYTQTGQALTGGTPTPITHGKGFKPFEVTFFESDGITPITQATWANTNINTITVYVADSYTDAIIKYIF